MTLAEYRVTVAAYRGALLRCCGVAVYHDMSVACHDRSVRSVRGCICTAPGLTPQGRGVSAKTARTARQASDNPINTIM